MKAKELIELLQKLDPDTELYTWDSSYGDNPVGGVAIKKDGKWYVG